MTKIILYTVITIDRGTNLAGTSFYRTTHNGLYGAWSEAKKVEEALMATGCFEQVFTSEVQLEPHGALRTYFIERALIPDE